MEFIIEIHTDHPDSKEIVRAAARKIAEELDWGNHAASIEANGVETVEGRRAYTYLAGYELESDEEQARMDALSDAGADAVAALARIYELNDGDEAAVGELMFEITKAAGRRYAAGIEGS